MLIIRLDSVSIDVQIILALLEHLVTTKLILVSTDALPIAMVIGRQLIGIAFKYVLQEHMLMN